MENEVREKFNSYPKEVRSVLEKIRKLIFEVAEDEKIDGITETLKWGEPSYLSKYGSTVRIDWKPKYPEQFAVYFNCKTLLIETFKELYGDLFNYEGNRAIVFGLGQALPTNQLRQCISMSLRYKKIRHLPLLGA